MAEMKKRAGIGRYLSEWGALLVAARHENVYLETSPAPLEVVEKAVCDPTIGPERVLFGSDSPAPYGHYRYRDKVYVSYMNEPPAHMPDHYKYDLAVIGFILAGTAVLGVGLWLVLTLV